MTSEEKHELIRTKGGEHRPDSNEKILWSLHAIRKLRAERLRTLDVETALTDCVLIEDYDFTKGRPPPSCLVLGFVGDEPVHVVLALDEAFDRVVIITVYRPSEERWENGWKQRKR